MKKAIALTICAVMCVCLVLSGCSPTNDKSPAQFKNIRWESPDYSFIIKPSDGCKGIYKFKDKKYNIKAVFESSYVYVKDTENKDTELFNAQWLYDDNDRLYIYDIQFNTDSYKEFKENYSEYVTLKKGKLN